MRRFLGCSLLLFGSLTQAQSADAPWYVGASLGLTRVSNLYRLGGDAAANDDTVRSATLLAGVQARLGRQRWKLDANLSQNKYQRNSQLGYNGHSVSASWDWASGSRLSGQLLAGSERTLAPFNPGNVAISTEKNIERNDRARAYARYGLYGLWAVDGGLTLNRRDFSIALYDRFEYTQRSADLGLRYQASAELSLRAATRQSRATYPRFGRVFGSTDFVEDRVRRKDLDLSADWTPSSAHQFALRLSSSTALHSVASAADYEGSSGSLNWSWVPTAKLLLQTRLWRDIGDDTREFASFFGTINSSNNRRYDGLRMQVVYQVSAKVSVQASVSEIRRDFVDEIGLQIRGNQDRTRAASLSARWAFDRNGMVSCQVAADRRTGSANEFSPPYRAHSSGCSLQYLLN